MKPNFLIIGSLRCGTTALYRFLQQHPEIYMSPEKETYFFVSPGKEIKDYEVYFEGVRNEVAIGEASPSYLYSSRAMQQIKYHMPQAKLIVMLRNPVDRAFSWFLKSSLLKKINLTDPVQEFIQRFEKEKYYNFTEQEIAWAAEAWRCRQGGLYYKHLKNYLNTFDNQKIGIYLYDDLNGNTQKFIKTIFNFLEVNSDFCPETSGRHNTSGVSVNRFTPNFISQNHRLKSAIRKVIPQKIERQLIDLSLQTPKLPLEVRQEMIQVYREDILRTQDLIQRDLSKWLQA